MCTEDPHIVITDRNPHVRELLFRELLRDGHRVTQARDRGHLLGILASQDVVHILILDPELHGIRSAEIGNARCAPPQGIKVVLHALPETELTPDLAEALPIAARVDKTADLHQLRSIVRTLLSKGGEETGDV